MKKLLIIFFIYIGNILPQSGVLDTLFKVNGDWIGDILYISNNEIYTSGGKFLKFSNYKLDTIYYTVANYFKKTPPYIVGSLMFDKYFVYTNNNWVMKTGMNMYKWFKNYFVNHSNNIYYYSDNHEIILYKNFSALRSINNLWIYDSNTIFLVASSNDGDGLWLYKNDSLYYLFNKPTVNFELGNFFVADRIYIIWPLYGRKTTIIYESNVDTSQFSQVKNLADITFFEKIRLGEEIEIYGNIYHIENDVVYLLGEEGKIYLMKKNIVDSVKLPIPPYEYYNCFYKISKQNLDSILLGGFFGLYLWRNTNLSNDEKINSYYHYYLSQNYPNPFNSSTTIKFALPEMTKVTLKVYNILGQEVATILENKELQAGYYDYEFNAAGLTSGTYIYRIVAGNFVQTKKMLLIK